MNSNPSQGDTTNQARSDALAGQKADTQKMSDAQRQTYESVHSTTKKST